MTQLRYGEPEFGVAWEGNLSITGFLSITDPVGTRNPPQLITFEVERTLKHVSSDGKGGSERLGKLPFTGTFVQEFETEHFPLSEVGHFDSSNGESDFYLEQVR